MSYRLDIRPDADTEIEEAAIWYETRRVGLGLEYVAAIDRTLRSIQSNPLRYPIWTEPWRRAVVQRFPYVVFFEVAGQRVIISAVAHARRRPGYWVARRSE